MENTHAEHLRIDGEHRITKETDLDFLYVLQDGLLLALKENHFLNEMQYRSAAEKLMRQKRTGRKT